MTDHGEVYTHPREVNAMLDLVKTETERVDSTFLEPACGTGNFLVEILSRKLAVVAQRYLKSQLEYERKAVLAISSLYGIDILADNIVICRARLFDVFNAQYSALYKAKCKERCRNTVRYLLSRNILHGDALSLKTVADSSATVSVSGVERLTTSSRTTPIIFSEWKFPFNDSRIKRHDYVFEEIFPPTDDLFTASTPRNDLGEIPFITQSVKNYPLIHFLEVVNAK
ncbi:MAG: DNA methyltransferase [Methyloglobulus sp.]|nr:SAM-dependent DNA methyltransferase [Methyloglobulus sp.]